MTPQAATVLVTGANGFLGNRVVIELLNRGYRVKVIVRPAASVEHLSWRGQVEICRADLRSASDLTAAFGDVDALIHLAAAVKGDEESQFASTVVGTERLLEAMARSKTKRLVLASSLSVYDWQSPWRVLDEQTPVEFLRLYERDGYAIAKVWQERVVRQFAVDYSRELVVLRPGFIWGEGNDFVPGLAGSVGSLHLVIGPLSRLPLTYVENCAQAFVAAVDSPKAVGRTINVIDDDSVRAWRFVGEWIRTASGRAGYRIPLPYWLGMCVAYLARAVSKALFKGKGKLPGILIPLRYRARFRPLRYDYSLARHALAWSPLYGFEAALERVRAVSASGSVE